MSQFTKNQARAALLIADRVTGTDMQVFKQLAKVRKEFVTYENFENAFWGAAELVANVKGRSSAEYKQIFALI